VPAIDRAALVQQRGNLRSNISKAKKSAETAKSEDKRSFYAQKAGQLEVELSQVEMQLAQPQSNA
jgi:anti-sigma28 factor (negative regulator of flagellin synthesis)